MTNRSWRVALGGLAVLVAGCAAASAQQCGGPDGFPKWLESFKSDAAAQGISASAIGALDGVRYDSAVIKADRAQGVFSQSFLEFSNRMVAAYRLDKGRQVLAKHRDTFDRIEREFGVSGPVIVAFWGLETDFGANLGKFSTLQSLATLAYDCRRPDQFRPELIAALKLLDHGELMPSDLIGAWAGEIGQMQFAPDDYLASAVDYDGDGRRNLVRSIPDVLASSASLLVKHGWQAGQPWLREVRVPADLPWDQADLAIRHQVSQWQTWGVSAADGDALRDGEASLLLPMGRKGPAFLAYPNFIVYTQWNRSLVYATTAAYFATRLAGAPKVQPGAAESVGRDAIIAMQRQLTALGYDVGGIDGTLGAQTRSAVKAAQAKLGLPADSYPDRAFLSALARAGG